MRQDREKVENETVEVVAVRLPKVPVSTHEKIKQFRKALIRKRGDFVSLTDAYYEFLRTR
jgi:hypothetical protein